MVSAETYLCIARQAQIEDRSKSSLVRVAIKQYLERQARAMAQGSPAPADEAQDLTAHGRG